MTAVIEALRNEVEVASDAVMLLMADGVIPRTPETMLRIARVLGFTVQDLRDADTRRARGYARPPESRTCLPPAEPVTHPKRPDLIMRTRPEGIERREPIPFNPPPPTPAVATPRAPVPTPAPPQPPAALPGACETAEKRICSHCAHPRHLSEFRDGFTVCKLCVWRKARRNRFLVAVGAHALEHTDELIGAACVACGGVFLAGQRIFATDVLLAHERCPKA